MHISAQTPDKVVLEELGARLREQRLARNESQAALAEQAGIGRVTLQRIEEGRSRTSLPSLIRVLRALDLTDGLDLLVPVPAPSPIEQLERQGRRRKRAGAPRAQQPEDAPPQPWRWGDEDDAP